MYAGGNHHGVSPATGHAYGCLCPPCVYYASSVMFAPSPYAMAQQFAQHPFSAASVAAAAFAAQSPYPGMPAHPLFAPPHTFVSQPRDREVSPDTTFAGNSPLSHFGGSSSSPRRLEFVPAAGAVAELFEGVVDMESFLCTPAGRDAAIAAVRAEATQQLEEIKAVVLPKFIALSADSVCVHVLRALVEVLTPSELERVVETYVSADHRETLNLATGSQHTRKILEALMTHRDIAGLSVIESTLVSNARYLAVTQQGCIALMQLIKVAPASHAELIQKILPSLASLAQDGFGNYVVQSLFEHADATAVEAMLLSLRGRFVALACNKYASNVLEKVVKANVQSTRRVIVAELVFHDHRDTKTVCADGYGNFVIQAIVSTAQTANEHKRICEKVRPALADSPHAARIEQKLAKRRTTQSGTSYASTARSLGTRFPLAEPVMADA
jgi:hypothetical protein